MRIENLKSKNTARLKRVSATVVWEDCDRPTQEIYFETTSDFAQDLSCNPHAFLVASIVPALHHGEKRVSIDAEICPELRDGLMTAMGWIRHWYELNREPVEIQAKTRTTPAQSTTPQRAGWFFSGGIDSLATLRHNRLTVPREHPNSFKDGLTIYGISSGGDEIEENEQFLDAFDRLVTSMSNVAQDAEVNLIPVYTNVRQLNTDTYFWSNEFQGAALASVAHAFGPRFGRMSIASTGNIPSLFPHGSHPLLDPNYSSYDLKIQHDGVTLSRLDKTKLVADWDVALQNLKVCTKVRQMQPGMLNCGKCDKCIRTTLALLALGKLEQASTFPKVEFSEEMLVKRVFIKTPYRMSCYEDLIPHLQARGRHDLVRAIERIGLRYRGGDWRGRVKKVVRRYFGGVSSSERLSASQN
ncbi:hypothetical protein H6F95_10760 [Cyanobacteria bacterium FACHB-471]|nr:hypothetical protein [Cyanobacteria bacterium FACHB-471]